jgi:hypothetical protein
MSTMLPDLNAIGSAEPPNIVIPCRGTTRLDDVRGMTLHVVHGSVWITQSGSYADVSLDAGESFCVAHSGRTLVAACHDAPFAEIRLERPHAVAPTLGERLRRILIPVKDAGGSHRSFAFARRRLCADAGYSARSS